MKLLIINLDKTIFKQNSRSLSDLKDYSKSFEKLLIISWTLKKEQPIFFENKLFIYPTNSKCRLFYFFDTFKIFKNFLEKEKIDLISSQDPFETGFVAWILGKIFKISLHIQIHTDFMSPYFRKESLLNCIRVRMAKFLIPRANCIRVVSERIKESLSDVSYQPSAISVLPIFVDTEKIKNAPIKTDLKKKYPQFDFIILMASRFTKEKNIKLAIDAMHDIAKEHSNTGLVIVGSGPEEKKLKAESCELKANIIFEPWTDDLASYYKTADLFLLTSNYEGYGMTLVEAVATECRVVSSDVGIAREILDPENIFEVGNKEQLKEKIIKAINGQIKPAKEIQPQTREQYLVKYKRGWEDCGKK